MGLPEMIEPGREGTPLWQTVDSDLRKTDPDVLTQRIKDYSRFLGISKTRVTKLKKEWVYTNYSHPYTPYEYGRPTDDMEYPNIICLAMKQNLAVMRSGDHYVPCLEVGWRYALTSLSAFTLANLIRSWGFRARPLPSENAPYMVVPAFVDAGMGEQGRMGICVTKEFGNCFRPAAVATDMPMTIDKPVDFGLQEYCENCGVCADACPVGAITKESRIVTRGSTAGRSTIRSVGAIGTAAAGPAASARWRALGTSRGLPSTISFVKRISFPRSSGNHRSGATSSSTRGNSGSGPKVGV